MKRSVKATEKQVGRFNEMVAGNKDFENLFAEIKKHNSNLAFSYDNKHENLFQDCFEIMCRVKKIKFEEVSLESDTVGNYSKCASP